MKKSSFLIIIGVIVLVGFISWMTMYVKKVDETVSHQEPTVKYTEIQNDKDKGIVKDVNHEQREDFELKIIGFESRNSEGEYDSEYDNLYWKYNANPQISLKQENDKLIIECYTGNRNGVTSYLNGDILSLLVKGSEAEVDFYHTFNIDLTSKKLLNSKEMLEKAGREYEDTKDLICGIEYKMVLENSEKAKKKAEELEEPADFLAWLDDLLYYYDENFDFSKVMFYENGSGELCYVSSVYGGSIADTSETPYLYNLNLNKVIK